MSHDRAERPERGVFEAQLLVAMRLIAERLEELGISQSRWARAATVHPSTISCLLTGRRTRISVRTIDRLLDAAWVISRHQVSMRPHVSLYGADGEEG